MSYFEEGSTRGFYILDLPNLTVGPRGFFTGASAVPFSYQGTSNSNAAQFSWNDPSLLTNFGYLRKWVDNGANLTDGNKNYDLATIPVGFNDFFSKRSGGGATYNAFVYKNGVLINVFFGGAGGTSSMPTFITSMPNFRVEQLTAAGSSMFNINFTGYKNKPIELVGQDGGTDNGFIRTIDGTCGSWTKSSADVNHTPGISNGKPLAGGGSISISAFLTRDVTNMTTKITYNVTSAALDIFPIEMQVYVDNGTVFGELDAVDTYVESKIENKVDDGPFTTVITPYNQNALIVIKQAAGCLDKVMFRDIIGQSTLPLTLTAWQGKRVDEQVSLTWSLAENELLNMVEVQRSTDGVNFTTAGSVFASEKIGTETYVFKENIKSSDRLMYRLKMIEKSSKIAYSKTLSFDSKNNDQKNVLQIMGNPVTNNLTLNYHASNATKVKLSIYNTMGHCVYNKSLTVAKGNNVWDIPVDFLQPNNNYMAEVSNDTERFAIKFLKK
jgi:hypothetical protein